MKTLSEERANYLYSEKNLSHLRRLNNLYKKSNTARLKKLARLRTKQPSSTLFTDSFELGYIIGVVCGDRNIGKYTVRLGCTDKDFAYFFKSQLDNWSGLCSGSYVRYSRIRSHKPIFAIELNFIKTCNFLKKFCLSN